jgi:hypothetical protein
MTKRIGALALILACAAVGWLVLSAVLGTRTQQANDDQQADLGSLWGPVQTQVAPSFAILVPKRRAEPAHRVVDPIEASTLVVALDLEQRQKGLLTYNTYSVAFNGIYAIDGADRAAAANMVFALPSPDASYDDITVSDNGEKIPFRIDNGNVLAALPLAKAGQTSVTVSYRSRGTQSWSYQMVNGLGSVHDFDLTMNTNFGDIDFAPKSLAPTDESRTANGWMLRWRSTDLVSSDGVSVVLPDPIQAGPVAERITAWAPLALFFYFFVIFILCTIRNINLHPMHYFFLAGAFFAFHLLFAYTVDRMPVGLAFSICSVVSMLLTASYLRIVVGLRFAAVEAALAQLFYLVLFSLALFNAGFSGLAITIGCIITLFVTMQLTARLDWDAVFDKGAPARTPAPARL